MMQRQLESGSLPHILFEIPVLRGFINTLDKNSRLFPAVQIFEAGYFHLLRLVRSFTGSSDNLMSSR